MSQLVQYKIIDAGENETYEIYLTPEEYENALSGKKYKVIT